MSHCMLTELIHLLNVDQKINSYRLSCRQKGFTLLEVLIALAVFSISSATLVLSDGQSVRQVSQVNNKVLASWLAENELNKLYIEKTWLNTGTSGRVEMLANRHWYVQRQVVAKEADFRQVVVIIYTGEKPLMKNRIYRLTGFIRRVKR